MQSCIFCKIIAGEIKTDGNIYEDKDIFVFLSNGPVNQGHTIIIPKMHCEQIYDMPDDVAGKIGIALKKFSIAVKKAVKADGINIHMNNEKSAGQEVFHAHFHIIPRYHGDGYHNWESRGNYKKGEIEAVLKKIRSEI